MRHSPDSNDSATGAFPIHGDASVKSGAIAALLALLLIMGASAGYAYMGLTAPDDLAPEQGLIAVTFGMMISLIAGVGIVAFVFCSSWRRYGNQCS
jgi:hypothetical protein